MAFILKRVNFIVHIQLSGEPIKGRVENELNTDCLWQGGVAPVGRDCDMS